MNNDLSQNICCSFCKRELTIADNYVIGGDGKTYICNDCIDDIKKIDFSTLALNNERVERTFPTPHEIYEHLNNYVIGQESAKRKLSVAVYNHYKRLYSNYNHNDCELEKSNIILLGPSGSGKTLLCKTIARMLDVPFVIADATSVTESGYVGEDVESILSKLLQASDYDIERAEQGIVFIDEIDKIGTKRGSTNITRDVSGEGVQQALLKMLEGTIVNCPPNGGRIHPEQKLIPIDTTNILFICSGAFVGMEDVINQRHNMHTVGFMNGRVTNNIENPLDDVTAVDLRKFGLIPEFIGRLPVIAHTTELTDKELYKILTEPKNAIIKQYKTLLAIDGKELEFDNSALKYIGPKYTEDYLLDYEDTIMTVSLFRVARSYYYMNECGYYRARYESKKNIKKILNKT